MVVNNCIFSPCERNCLFFFINKNYLPLFLISSTKVIRNIIFGASGPSGNDTLRWPCSIQLRVHCFRVFIWCFAVHVKNFPFYVISLVFIAKIIDFFGFFSISEKRFSQESFSKLESINLKFWRNKKWPYKVVANDFSLILLNFDLKLVSKCSNKHELLQETKCALLFSFSYLQRRAVSFFRKIFTSAGNSAHFSSCYKNFVSSPLWKKSQYMLMCGNTLNDLHKRREFLMSLWTSIFSIERKQNSWKCR